MSTMADSHYIQRFLKIPISSYFSTKLEEYNSIFGQQQIENIYYTISLIETKNKNEKIDHLLRNNIHKCVSWCIKMGLPYNQIANTNIFLFHKNGDFPLDYETLATPKSEVERIDPKGGERSFSKKKGEESQKSSEYDW
jgi:hypothetical protein